MLERKLRIMMLAPTDYFNDCGYHARIYEEARALIRRGHSVRIVTYASGRDMPGVAICRIARVPGLKILPTRPGWHKLYLDIFLFYRALKLAREFRPHLIHSFQHEGALIGCRLKKRLAIPHIVDYLGSLSREMVDHGLVKEGSWVYRLFSRMEQHLDSTAGDYVIARSACMAHQLISSGKMPPERVESLGDGVDTIMFRPYSRDEMRTRLRLSPDVKLVVYLGALTSREGIDTLLSAIVQLKSKGSPMRFLIMGSPEEQYRDRAVALGIERMIIFTGRIEYANTPFYLSAGDLAVSPKCSLAESNGKLLNYLACGLPTVAFDTPENREIMGDACIYASYPDSTDLADKLSWLMDNDTERSRLAVLARERSVQLHSWDMRGKLLDEIYRVKLRR